MDSWSRDSEFNVLELFSLQTKLETEATADAVIVVVRRQRPRIAFQSFPAHITPKPPQNQALEFSELSNGNG